MNFTGERVIPGLVEPDLLNEHVARYLFARRLCQGKRVLDAACGAGYGTAMLAEAARVAVGVDISEEAVRYARQNYGRPNVHYTCGDALGLPFASASFDCIAAFEIVEHLADAPAFLSELKRVLAPGGLLLLSTPNRLYYTDDRGVTNPFHQREYDYGEFDALLRDRFRARQIWFQNHTPGIAIAPAAAAQSSFGVALLQTEPAPGEETRAAHFLIALCSDAALPAMEPFFYAPSTGNVLREREQHIRNLARQVAESEQERDLARRRFAELEQETQQVERCLRARINELEETLASRTEWAQGLDRTLAERDAYLLQLQAEHDAKARWATELNNEVARLGAALQKLQGEFDERTQWALQLDRQLREREATIQALNVQLRRLLTSTWHRIGRNLRLSPMAAPKPAPESLPKGDPAASQSPAGAQGGKEG